MKSPEWYSANPHARMSFSRLATYERCPAWYRHQYLDWHRTWNLPVLRAGHLVQSVLERVFDGEPAADVDPDRLFERASARALALFARAWEAERRAHESDPNGCGPFAIPRERYEGYVRRGIEFHLLEVKARLEGRHPRTGEPLDLAPAQSVAEAWRDVRPVHAAHDGEAGSSMEALPEGYLQGEYDLVYGWTGRRRIVDLKASGGTSPFSGEISRQLASYALIETRLGRGMPEGLEAWFLGRSRPDVFPLTSAGELAALDADVRRLIALSRSEEGFGAWNASDFPAEPKAVDGFPPAPGDPSIWCAYCPAAPACPRSACEKVDPGDGIRAKEPGGAGGSHAIGQVLGIAEARERSTGRQTRRFTLANSGGAISFTWDASAVERLTGQGLKAGRVVRLSGLRPWVHPSSKETLWYDTRATGVDVLAESFGSPRLDPEDP